LIFIADLHRVASDPEGQPPVRCLQKFGGGANAIHGVLPTNNRNVNARVERGYPMIVTTNS
jgi:hypothetical protein